MESGKKAIYFRLLMAVIVMALFPHNSDCQYINTILEYKPAPGQFINSSGGTRDAAEGIKGENGGLVSLGAFGGYIVFSFESAVENDAENPYGVDFVIFGNATKEFSEPGIVSVMRDDNLNSLPDDIWYEIAGSEYSEATTIKDYMVSYSDPKSDAAADVLWEDNFSNTGNIPANSFHTQSYYPGEGFDAEFYSENCSFSGTKIEAETDISDVFRIKSFPKKYGYADNIPSSGIISSLPDNPYTDELEGMGGDAIDISWAVDNEGKKISLDKIHFIKVHTAVLGDVGPLGELSTEIRSAVDIAPVPGMPNSSSDYKMEALVTVFPNPFMDEIRISGLNKSKIHLLSLEGKILYNCESDQSDHIIETPKLQAGVYFLKISSEHETQLIPLIKNGN